MSSLTVNDAIFHSTITNYTILANNLTISKVIVTNSTIEFHGLTSVGGRITNINDINNARIEFFNLGSRLTIRNLNRSTNLFSSLSTSNNFSAPLAAGEILAIEDTAKNACNSVISELGAYTIFVGFIGIIILIGAVMFALVTGFIAQDPGKALPGLLFGGMLIVVLLGVLVIVGIAIVNGLCVLL